MVEEAADDEGESDSDSEDARDVGSVGTCIGGEDIVVNGNESKVTNSALNSLSITGDNNTVVGGPDSGAPVSGTGTGNTVIQDVIQDAAAIPTAPTPAPHRATRGRP